MYNDAQKKRFISEYATSSYMATKVVRLFNRVAPLEIHLGKDLCFMDVSEAQPFIDELPGVTMYNASTNISIVRSYVLWCEKNGIISAESSLLQLKMDQSAAMRKSMYDSPASLNAAFDRVFHPVDEKTVHNVYRAFLWLGYIGLQLPQTDLIEKSSVDFNRSIVTFEAVERDIYMEAIQAFKSCVYDTEFCIISTKRRYFAQRPQSKLLLSRLSPTVDYHEFSKLISALPNTKRYTLRYDNIRYSGIFYRAYQLEQQGIPVDFKAIVTEEVKQRVQYGDTERQIYTRIMAENKRYVHDYNAWKMAFDLK